MQVRVDTYGRGGLDPAKPANNIVDTGTVTVDDEREAILAKAAQVIDNLETADQNWPQLTNAQKDAAMRLAVRASAKLARLTLGRLEAS